MEQIFGWTQQLLPPTATHVQYIAVFETDRGVLVRVRDGDGSQHDIEMPRAEGVGMGVALAALNAG